MGKRINIAVLGAGNIAESMSRALLDIKDEVNMYAVASRSLSKAESFAKEFGYEKAYGSYEEAVKDENVDLVYIATLNSEHYSNAKMCLENGKGCLVEKAFCSNKKQAEELIEIARKKNLFLSEAMWTRFLPAAMKIGDMLKEGVIGKPHYLEADFCKMSEETERITSTVLAGGVLLNLGVYALTMPQLYFGLDVVKVKASCEKYMTGADKTDEIMLTYKNGNMARIKASTAAEPKSLVKIAGDKGYVKFGPVNRLEYIEVYDTNGELKKREEFKNEFNPYCYEILSCKRALLEGKNETEEMPWDKTLLMMGWLDSVRNHLDIRFDFEKEGEIEHKDEEIWGNPDVFDDTNPWDRSNTTSYLEVYDINTKEIKTLAEFPYVIEAPNWSHNGKFLTYNANGLIYKYDLADGKSEKIESGNLCKINNDHVLSGDDSEIAVSDETKEGGSRIYRIPLEAGEVTLVTKKAPSYLHGWTLDKKKFCYCAERSGEYDVYECELDGSGEKRLTTAPCLNDGCEYDAKGEYIYFNSVRTGLMQAWKMKADGSAQEQMTYDADLNTWFPHISPDGKKIVMVSYKKGDLWPGDHVPNKNVKIRLMDSDGTKLHTIIELFGGQGTINVNSWSPDSTKFAYVRYEKK